MWDATNKLEALRTVASHREQLLWEGFLFCGERGQSSTQRQRLEGGLLSHEPSLLGEFQASERPCLKTYLVDSS